MTDPTEDMIRRMMGLRNQQIRDYEDALLRWLRVKRDYPWNTEPEPEEWFVTVFLHRDRIVREFNRTV